MIKIKQTVIRFLNFIKFFLNSRKCRLNEGGYIGFKTENCFAQPDKKEKLKNIHIFVYLYKKQTSLICYIKTQVYKSRKLYL